MPFQDTINRHALQSLLTQVPVIALNFVAGVFLVRLFGVEGKGVHAYLLANAELALLLLGFNVHLGVVYFTAKNKQTVAQTARIAVSVMLLAFCTFGGLLWALVHFSSPLLGLFLPEGHQEPFFAMLLFGLFATTFANNVLVAFLQGYKQFGALNLLRVLARLLACAVYAGAYMLRQSGGVHFGLHQIFGAVFLVELANLLLAALFCFRSTPLRIRPGLVQKKHLKPFVSYLYLGWFASLAVFVNRRVDVWFVESYRGVAELGQYAVAAGYVAIGDIVMVALVQVLLPHLAAMQPDDRSSNFAFFSRINLLLAAGMASVAFLVAAWVIPFVYGPDFTPSVQPAKILCLGLVFNSVRNLCSAYNYALNRLKYNIMGDFTALAVTLSLNFLLVPRLGMTGAAITSAVAYGISAAVLAAGVLPHARLGAAEAFMPQKNDLGRFLGRLKA